MFNTNHFRLSLSLLENSLHLRFSHLNLILKALDLYKINQSIWMFWWTYGTLQEVKPPKINRIRLVYLVLNQMCCSSGAGEGGGDILVGVVILGGVSQRWESLLLVFCCSSTFLLLVSLWFWCCGLGWFVSLRGLRGGGEGSWCVDSAYSLLSLLVSGRQLFPAVHIFWKQVTSSWHFSSLRLCLNNSFEASIAQ